MFFHSISSDNEGNTSGSSWSSSSEAPQSSPIINANNHNVPEDSLNQVSPASQESERIVLTRGSVDHLNGPYFFWSGSTLEDLHFHDRKPWLESKSQPYPYEYLPRTTIEDIIEIFNTVAPPIFHPHQSPTTRPCRNGDGKWFLAYLDGTAQSALDFRKAVLDTIPPPPQTSDESENSKQPKCIFLEILCIGIMPEIRCQLDRCPSRARVLAMMRTHYTFTSDAEHFHFYGLG